MAIFMQNVIDDTRATIFYSILKRPAFIIMTVKSKMNIKSIFLYSYKGHVISKIIIKKLVSIYNCSKVFVLRIKPLIQDCITSIKYARGKILPGVIEITKNMIFTVYVPNNGYIVIL